MRRQGVEFPRSGCALQGAVEAARAVGGFVPIIHSTAGCGLRDPESDANAPLPGRLCGAEVPSGNILHRHVIFGGGSRLREQIKNAVRVMRGDLYLVIPGCATEMIGDDIEYMVEEARTQQYPVLQIHTTGFKGTAYSGYVQFVKDVWAQFAPSGEAAAEHTPRLVNLLGDIPGSDPFWEGNLEELAAVLAAVDVRATRLFGYGSSLAEWKCAAGASLNLVFSGWGKAIAQWAEETFGTPYLEFPSVPVGAEQTQGFLFSVADRLGLDRKTVEAYAYERRQQFLYRLGHASADYVRYGFQRDFSMVGESYIVLGLARFLRDTLGCTPKALVLTDGTPQSDPELQKIAAELEAAVLVREDLDEIETFLRAHPSDLLLGSALEKTFADKSGIPLLEISAPMEDAVLLGSGCAGYDGALRLLESLFAVLRQEAKKRRRADHLSIHMA